VDSSGNSKHRRGSTDLGVANSCRRSGNVFHPCDVEHWSHRAIGSAGNKSGTGGWCRSSYLCFDRCNFYIQLLPYPNPSGQCPVDGPRRIFSCGLHAGRRVNDGHFPDCQSDDDQSGLLSCAIREMVEDSFGIKFAIGCTYISDHNKNQTWQSMVYL